MTEQDEKTAEKKQENLITLSTGVVIRAKAIPPGAYIAMAGSNPRPKMPTIWFEDEQRLIQNPDQEDYLEELKEWKEKDSKSHMNLMVAYGTELVSVPKNMKGPKSNDWIEKLALLGGEVKPESKHWRYLNWMFAEACITSEDYALVSKEVGRLSGVTEDDVAESAEFPGS